MSNSVLYWNDVALDTNSWALAIIHLAMHDAYFSINPPAAGTFALYTDGLNPPQPPAGASADAAVAAAAYYMLVKLFPSQRSIFDAKLVGAPNSGGDTAAGHMYGIAIAELVWSLRKDDVDAGDAGYSPSPARGRHRPDPDNQQSFPWPLLRQEAAWIRGDQGPPS
jgi:vanadium chloroperoxidase